MRTLTGSLSFDPQLPRRVGRLRLQDRLSRPADRGQRLPRGTGLKLLSGEALTVMLHGHEFALPRRRLTHDRHRRHRRGAGRIQRRHHRQKARSIRRRHRPEYRLARPRGARRQLSRPARYLRARPAERHGQSGAGAGRGAAPRRRPSGDRHGRFVRALAGRGFHRGAARHPLHRRQTAQAAPPAKTSCSGAASAIAAPATACSTGAGASP